MDGSASCKSETVRGLCVHLSSQCSKLCSVSRLGAMCLSRLKWLQRSGTLRKNIHSSDNSGLVTFCLWNLEILCVYFVELLMWWKRKNYAVIGQVVPAVEMLKMKRAKQLAVAVNIWFASESSCLKAPWWWEWGCPTSVKTPRLLNGVNEKKSLEMYI